MLRVCLIWLLLIGQAHAQTQCPPQSIQAWSATLPPPAQFMVYDLNGVNSIPPGMLSILYLNRTAEIFIDVPQTVAQQFPVSKNPNPTVFFNTRIKPVYHELLVIQNSNCPLFLAQVALWTK